MPSEHPDPAEDWRAAHGLALSGLLLAWFDRAGRTLPWRQNKDPYRIWLSEIMLQQTQVQTVIPYFERFLRSWPTLADLAAAPEAQVLKQWEGLGYYSRARHLQSAARLVCQQYDGVMPTNFKALRSLPGIGDYTAGAILSIAFGQPVAAVDGNVVRVFSRLTAVPWDPSDPAQRREISRLVERLLPHDRPGDLNEAMMDLGATICLPRLPNCADCPLASLCRASQEGKTGQLPLRPVRKARPTEVKVLFALVRHNRVRIRQRPPKGLLAGLWEFDWIDSGADLRQAYPGVLILPLGSYTHVFTHRRWQMDGYLVNLGDDRLGEIQEKPDSAWVGADELVARPFPGALAGYRSQVLAFLRENPDL